MPSNPDIVFERNDRICGSLIFFFKALTLGANVDSFAIN